MVGESKQIPTGGVDVRVSRVRRKLQSDPLSPKIIRTVYGVGYLLAVKVKQL